MGPNWYFGQLFGSARSVNVAINFFVFDGFDYLKASGMVDAERLNIIDIIGKNCIIFIII